MSGPCAATQAVRAGIDRDSAFGAVVPPIVLSSNFSFAHTGRTNHDYVLGHHVHSHVRGQLLPAHAVSQRDSHRTFCLALSYDMFVELGHNLTR